MRIESNTSLILYIALRMLIAIMLFIGIVAIIAFVTIWSTRALARPVYYHNAIQMMQGESGICPIVWEKPSPSAPAHLSHVKFTFYLPKEGSRNGLTALGTRATPGRTVAVSRDLAKQGWLGRTVYIPGYGVRLVEDLMDKSIKGNRVDICMASRNDYPDNFTGYMTVVDNARKLKPDH